MPNFHNPYQFVPVMPVKVVDPDDRGQVTHDRFVPRAYSGRLLCRLTTESPVVIGGKQDERLDDATEPCRVHPFTIDGTPAVPASSLRGLISSIAEAASNSALRVLEDATYSCRADYQKECLPALGMIVDVAGANGATTRRLLPLTLPPLEWDEARKCTVIPELYRGLTTAHIGAYVDGYRKVDGPDGPELDFWRPSFLAKNDPDSFSSQKPVYWYMRLDQGAVRSHDAVTIPKAFLKIRADERNKRELVLAQRAIDGRAPLSQAEYDAIRDPVEQEKYTRGILRVLGIKDRQRQLPPTKKHEVFIPFSPGAIDPARTLDMDAALATFLSLAAERTAEDKLLPFDLKGAPRKDPATDKIEFRHGDLVYFKPEPTVPNTVAELAISSIWRRTAGSCHAAFERYSTDLLPYHSRRTGVTIAEDLFGFVQDQDENDEGNARALASRVRFSHASLHCTHTDYYEPEVTLQILASPKPPCPAFYFQRVNGQGPPLAKGEMRADYVRPRGRKFYLHHKLPDPIPPGEEPWKTGNHESPEQKNRVQPLRAGLPFYFHIDFINLSERELALLCYAIQPTPAFRHKLGMGKPLGLGRVRIDPVGLFFIDRDARYRTKDLFGPRYHGVEVLPEVDCTQWPARYSRECAAAETLPPGSFPKFDDLCQLFWKSMDEAIGDALEAIGDPDKVQLPVHYPQVRKEGVDDLERESFRWFVENEKRRAKGAGLRLRPIQRVGDHVDLPSFSRLTETENRRP